MVHKNKIFNYLSNFRILRAFKIAEECTSIKQKHLLYFLAKGSIQVLELVQALELF